ncbi:hypothetical protein ABH313_09025 [Chromobacterium vaccinii]|uniref:hypothetical protein n=1 Tax=Chromobacterium vaccinii TaxID=1108595 RepID=UPI003260C289
MRPTFFRKALASLLLLAACLASRAGEPPGLIVDFDASNPPLMYAGKQGAAGLYPLLVSKACERAGIAVTLRAVSWRMALQELRNGSAAAGASPSPCAPSPGAWRCRNCATAAPPPAASSRPPAGKSCSTSASRYSPNGW